MPLPTTLLKAVIDDPENDSPRVDVEQWCRNNGHIERAELIRIQLALGILVYNPSRNAYNLAFDAERLAEKHGQNWLQYDELNQWVDGYQYYRGFVEQITLSAETFLQHGQTILSKSPIRHLDLTHVDANAEALFESPLLSNIVSLSIKENNLTDFHMALLARSPHLGRLRWLSLMLNKIDMSGAEELAKSKGLKQLKYVNFYGNEVDPTENLVVDQGVVIDTILPEEGAILEARYGPIRWLHPKAEMESDLPPLRFTSV